MVKLRDVWEATSFQLEMRQANPACVAQEKDNLQFRETPQYKVSFDWDSHYYSNNYILV
mgnify:CR=1 FL=1